MCPACISTAVLIVGSVISTGSLAAITIKKFGGGNAPDQVKEREKNHDSGTPDGPQERTLKRVAGFATSQSV